MDTSRPLEPEDIGLVPPPEASPRRNHGRIDPNRLAVMTRIPLMELTKQIRHEDGLEKVQVTFDLANLDAPPVVTVITTLDDESIDRWLS